MSHRVSAGLSLHDITEKTPEECSAPRDLKVKNKHQTKLGGNNWKEKLWLSQTVKTQLSRNMWLTKQTV